MKSVGTLTLRRRQYLRRRLRRQSGLCVQMLFASLVWFTFVFPASTMRRNSAAKARDRFSARWPSEKKSLGVCASARAQKIQLLFGLDTFSSGRHTDFSRKGYDAPNHRSRFGCMQCFPDERAIDLQFVEREANQCRHGRKARSKIVEYQSDSGFPKLSEIVAGGDVVSEKYGFCHLDV